MGFYNRGDFGSEKKGKKDEKLFLILSGPYGSGKTYIAAALVPWLFANFKTRRVWKEYDLFSSLRRSIESGHDFRKALEYSSDDEVVILDDLGSCQVTEWRKEVINNFVDVRYSAELPTIFTTNLTPDQIEERFGGAVKSRLFGYQTVFIDFYGHDDLRSLGY